ncbi:MAG TPA: 6-phosphogluconolactonase [Bacteroidetes bacterium]|nr:6-phosphogluconolactonase [Bacteroidota bacterium]
MCAPALRKHEVRVFDNADALAGAAADVFLDAVCSALEQRGRFAVALSGGKTPKRTYTLLAEPARAGAVDWERVFAFWGDERCVPPTHSDSNYRMVAETLLMHVPIPEHNVHRIICELTPEEAARLYEADLRRFFVSEENVDSERGSPKTTFDLVLLGLGEDGHTASLFPGFDLKKVGERWVAAVEATQGRGPRVTLTPRVLNRAGLVVFIVEGKEKSTAVAEVLQGDGSDNNWPARWIQPKQGRVIWMLDKLAAQNLRYGRSGDRGEETAS